MNIFRCYNCGRLRTEYEIKVQEKAYCKCGSNKVWPTEKSGIKAYWHLLLWNFHLNFGKLKNENTYRN